MVPDSTPTMPFSSGSVRLVIRHVGGQRVNYNISCSTDCGGTPYEGDLYMWANSGIGTGSLVCTEGGCPGEAPTINCYCSTDDGDDDSIFDEDDQ